MKPSLEIFTTRRSPWLTRREDALQADAMPVFPSAEDDTGTEATTSRRGSGTAEGQWDGAEGDDADVYEDEDEDDGGFELYHSDGENHPGLRKFKRGDPEVRSSGETPRDEEKRLSPGLLVGENTETETEQDSPVEEPCALGAADHKRSRDGEAGALGMESWSCSGSRGQRQGYPNVEVDRGIGGSMTIATLSSLVQRSTERMGNMSWVNED